MEREPLLAKALCATSSVAASICMLVLHLPVRSSASFPFPVRCMDRTQVPVNRSGSIQAIQKPLQVSYVPSTSSEHFMRLLPEEIKCLPKRYGNTLPETCKAMQVMDPKIDRLFHCSYHYFEAHHDLLLKLHFSHSGAQLAMPLFPLQELPVCRCFPPASP